MGRLCIGALLAGALVIAGAPRTATAGADDFEYGQALAKKGQETGDAVWFTYAKRVFAGILSDRNRSQADHNEALYGMATLKRGEALAAAANSKVPYTEVLALFQVAVRGIEKFVRENPKHPNAVEAKVNAGEARLNFVQWARGLLEDPDRLAQRGAGEPQVQADAREMVDAALAYFDALDDGWQEMDATLISQIARFHWVTCKYFSALIYPDCSTQAIAALTDAGTELEDFISFFDGQLVAIFAQDFYGLAEWELGRCAENEGAKVTHYRLAVDWFDTVIQTELSGRDSLSIIARGYLHIAQCCLDAGRLGGVNFLKRARNYLRKMTAKVPPILTTVDGIRAMIAWGEVEAALDNKDKALEVLTEAKKKAQATGRIWLVNRANKRIGIILKGGDSGEGGVSVGADVLKSVADDQFVAKNYASAIDAYQRVIEAAGDGPDDLMRYIVPAWKRIAECYSLLGDLLSAALATEPVHAAWMDGRIPHKLGDKNDANLIAMGNLRMRAQRWLKELFDETGSPAYRRRWTENRDSFTKDYAGHPTTGSLDYRVAYQKYADAREQRGKKSVSWKATLREAITRFQGVAKDDKSPMQQRAQVMLVRCEYVKSDWKGMIAQADAAVAYWATPGVKKLAKEQPTIADRIAKAAGKIAYWKGLALVELRRWDEVIQLFADYEIQHGDMEATMLSGALGGLVQAYIGKGDIAEASKYHKKLLRQYPDYFRLPKITFELARYYEKQYSAIETKLKADTQKLYGTAADRAAGVKAQWRKASEEANIIAERLIDLNGDRNKAQAAVRFWEEDVLKEKKEKGKFTANDYKRAKWRLEGSDKWDKNDKEYGNKLYKVGLVKTIADLNQRLKEATARRDRLWEQVVAIEKRIAKHKLDMYPPLKSAANFYWDWDQVMKVIANKKRAAQNIGTFAYRFFYATVLNPDDADSWNKARLLYEDYLKMPGVDEDEKAGAAAKLGKIYSHLSDTAKAETKRKEYSLKALELLQEALARNPVNNPIVVRQLAGDLVVVPWSGKLHEGEQFRFPIARIKDVAGLRRAVKELGTDAAPMPKFRDARKQRHFDDELAQFKKHIAGLSDPAAASIVKNFANAGFDPYFYKQHANTRPEFRLALARVYATSGRIQDVRKALNLCYSLTGTGLRVADDTEAWWEAQAIKLEAYLKGASIGLKSGQENVKAEAKEMLERAGKSIRNLYSNDHSLGEEVRPATPEQMQVILGRLNALRRQLNMSDVKLRIEVRQPAGGAGAGSGASGGNDGK